MLGNGWKYMERERRATLEKVTDYKEFNQSGKMVEKGKTQQAEAVVGDEVHLIVTEDEEKFIESMSVGNKAPKGQSKEKGVRPKVGKNTGAANSVNHDNHAVHVQNDPQAFRQNPQLPMVAVVPETLPPPVRTPDEEDRALMEEEAQVARQIQEERR